MPNALTHFHIFEQAMLNYKCAKPEPLKKFFESLQLGLVKPDGGEDKSLHERLGQVSNITRTSFRNRILNDLIKKKGYTAEKIGPAILASYGYLGSNGPDIFLVPGGLVGKYGSWAKLGTLCHHNTTGGPVIYALTKLKSDMDKLESMGSDDRWLWRYKLAYWLGHITHMAADIVVHPFVNSRAGANKLLEKKYWNFQGGATKKIWSLHNIVEQLQDRWILNENKLKSLQVQNIKKEWRKLAFPALAAVHLRQKEKHRFIGEWLSGFYGWSKANERSRLDYWYDSRKAAHVAFRNYLINVLPSKGQLPEKDKKFLVGPEEFGEHIKVAIQQSKLMIGEALEFLSKGSNATGESPRDQVSSVRKSFPLLYANFNLDAGLCFRFHPNERVAGVGKKSDIPCRIPVRLELKTSKCLDKGPPEWPYKEAKVPTAGVAKTGAQAPLRPLAGLGADVITEGLKRPGQEVDFQIYELPFNPDRVGEDQDKIGERIRKKEYAALAWDLLASVSAAKRDLAKTDKVESCSVLLLSLPLRSAHTEEVIWKLNEKMNLVPTVCASGVWKRKGSGTFVSKDVKASTTAIPSEQLFVKVYLFEEDEGRLRWVSGGQGLQSRLYGGTISEMTSWLEPGINKCVVVVDTKHKLKVVYLDGLKVWEAEESEEG